MLQARWLHALPGLLSPQRWVDPAAEVAGVLQSATGALGTALLQYGVGGRLTGQLTPQRPTETGEPEPWLLGIPFGPPCLRRRPS